MPRHLAVRRPFVVALVASLALTGCSRVLPTSPDAGGPATSVARPADEGAASVVQQPVGDSGGTLSPLVPDPTFATEPGERLLGGLLRYVVRLVQRVLPGVETVLQTGRWTLDVHSGSLTSPKVITIAPATDGSLRVRFGPDGTQFDQPVDLAIDYSGTALDPASPGYVPGTLPVFLYYDPALGSWVEQPSVNDAAHKVVHAQLHHFSLYGLGGRAGW